MATKYGAYILIHLYCILVNLAIIISTGSVFSDCIKDGLLVSEVFCLPNNYRKDVPPTTNGPLNVFFKLPVTEVSEINDHKSQLTIRLAYKLRWPEHRMVLNESADWTDGEINVRPEMIEYFWSPDIIIHDLISFVKPQVLNDVGAMEILRDQSVYYKVRSTVTTVCKGMEFSRFPMDTHTCLFKLTSYGYDTSHMKLSGKFSYQRANQRVLAFNTDIRPLEPHQTQFTGSSRNYSVYGMQIVLKRSLGPFILSVYLPSGMFVVMSWVSFFIPPDIVPARIVLLVTLCLVLINMFNFTTARIPVANSITAMEVWLLACIVLVFLTLVEYAVILREEVLIKRNKRKALSTTSTTLFELKKDDLSNPSSVNSIHHQIEKSQEAIQMTHCKSNISLPTTSKSPFPMHLSPNNIAQSLPPSPTKQPNWTPLEEPPHHKINWDKHATTLFPVLAATFNCIYWVYYLYLDKK